jgi:SAM-dependent methyltransferase
VSANEQQIAYWNDEVGPIWVENQKLLDRVMEPLTKALLQIASPFPGEHVLEIGCGCGELALRLADRVDASGAVRAVDVSRPMLAAARTRWEKERKPQMAPIVWEEADAMTSPFAPPVDLMVSRFGIMFFADRVRAFANLKRALKPGGRFVFLAWRGRREVEWFERPLSWIAPVLPTPEPTDSAIGPCALADGEATRALLEDAGFRNVQAEPLDRSLPMGPDVESAFALLSRTGPAAGLMRAAEPEARNQAAGLLRAGLAGLAARGPIELHGACWIYRGLV